MKLGLWADSKSKCCCHQYCCHQSFCHIKYIKLPSSIAIKVVAIKYIKLPSGGLQATSSLQCLHSGGVPEHSPPKAEGKQEPFLWRVKIFVLHLSNFHLIKLVDQISDNINITPLCCHSLPPPRTSPGLNCFELVWVWLG